MYVVGSYPESEVSLLLSDSSVAKYADFQPTPAYQGRLRAYVVASAGDIATLVGTLAERVLTRHGDGAVLVSIARSGIPVGILVKRWLAARHALNVPHFSLSIANGVVDESALSALLRRFTGDRIQFLDGWTSKGTVAGLLARTCRSDPWRSIDPALAVVVDPCATAALSATSDDVLLPHACLGAQMSGLLGPPHRGGDGSSRRLHRVNVRRDLSNQDMTGWYLDQIVAQYDAVACSSDEYGCDDGLAASRLHQADAVAARFGLRPDEPINVGISEAARGLFRPTPRRLVVRQRHTATDLLCDIARERGVPIDVDPALLVEAITI